MSPSPTRARIARRSRRLKLRPRIAASPSAALVRAGSRAARRSMRVRTADGTSRAALRPRRHSPSTCWSVPASRWVRASSSTMNGTPSDWACIAAADEASTGPASTRFRSSAVSREPNRPGRIRRTRPIRSMSATKLTASVTVANSSGRIVMNRKIGWSESLRTTYRRSRSVSSSAHWTSSMRSAIGRIVESVAIATPARSNALRSFASGDRLSNPGSSRPEIASTTRRTAASAGVPAAVSRIASDANRLRARRNGPRISSSAVIATQVNPAADASSAAASSRRVLPMPGSPSSVTADSRPDASSSSCEIAPSSALRPMTPPDARRSWTASEHWGPTTGSSTSPSATRRGEASALDRSSPSVSRIMRRSAASSLSLGTSTRRSCCGLWRCAVRADV